jgi:HD-GYP domain-containing protein (c-di-GMP phosphodiesterase class II)
MDAGWCKVPNHLFTLQSEYTDDEYELIQEHIDHSVKVLDDAGFDYDVTGLVVKHHERFDGTGYYSNYEGSDIPLMSQILSLADHYNSLIKGYYCTSSIIPAHALKQIYLKAKQGSHDIGLVELLIQVVGVYPLSSAVVLNTQEKAVITRVNWRDGMSPTVRIFYDKNGVNRMKPMDVDLYNIREQDNPRKIQKILDTNIAQNDPANLLHFSV